MPIEDPTILDFKEKRPADVKLISTTQFAILSVATLGIYNIYWCYKMWKFYKQSEDLDIMPFWRALFSIFFLISLFDRILKHAQSKGYEETYSSTTLFLIWLGLNLTNRLPGVFSFASIFNLFTFFPPIKAYNYALLHSESVNAAMSSGFNARQVVLVLVGILLWILVILGLMDESMGGTF